MKNNFFQSCELSVVIPIFNEAHNIPELHKRLKSVFEQLKKDYEIIFVNDGSSDESLGLLVQLHQAHKGNVRVVNLARNFGHQLAITAGLSYSKGKAVVIMDADLQDPPEVITDFVKKWEEGYEIVYGRRSEREGETYFKKATASLFYKMIRATTAIDIPENVGDFYLLDRKIVDIINSLRERHRFMRGLVAWVGFKRIGVDYVRKPRFTGKTKYSFWKMVKFSIDAMTSFSFTPLRFVSWLGAIISVIAVFGILLIIYLKLFTNVTVVGWSSLMVVVLFIGGVQLLATGIIGEYIARIGDDVKSRPLFTVSEVFE